MLNHQRASVALSISTTASPTSLGLRTPLGRITATAVHRSYERVPRTGLRRLGAFALVYILAGEGRYQDETGLDVEVGTGDLLQILPSLGHAYGPYSESPWVERYVVFEGPVFSLWAEVGLLDGRHPVLHLSPVDEWNRRIDHLFGASGRVGVISGLEEICRLQELLAKMHAARHTGGEISTEDRLWLSAACALLSSCTSYPDDIATLRSVADSLSLSYDGFRKRFRRLAGVSPGRYRAYQQMTQACEMLQSCTMTNREIAEHLGFNDEAHFSKRFKQLTGRSPRAFKAMLPAVSQHE